MGAVAAALLASALAGEPSAAEPAPSPAPQALLARLRAAVPVDPIGLEGDPYERWADRPPPRPPPGTVCAVRILPDGIRYRLTTYPSEAEARDAGFSVTHLGACGTCSTLQDLAVYLERPDLVTPVRRCGIRLRASRAISCLEEIGFTGACARTWFWNTRNTRRECLATCLWSWVRGEPPTRPDGGLNDCLRCDEERSGPVFQAVAGRTRRNSGIRSSIPRSEEEVAPLRHDYLPGAPDR